MKKWVVFHSDLDYLSYHYKSTTKQIKFTILEKYKAHTQISINKKSKESNYIKGYDFTDLEVFYETINAYLANSFSTGFVFIIYDDINYNNYIISL